MQSTGCWSDGHGKVEDYCLTFSWQGTRWWYDSHGNLPDVVLTVMEKVQDGGLTVMARYMMVVLQSWQGTGWWSDSHGKVQDDGLTVS